MRHAAALLSLVLSCLPATAFAGSSVRYALIVGNNRGNNPDVALDTLHHAEREAQGLRDQLVRYANFDPTRVELVLGGTRAAILAAAARLASQHRLDVAAQGELPSLFTFFFTGHGLAGKLLTADEPLTGDDLARLVKQMGASLTLGFFDACFSGSLDLDVLKNKGLVATPGFNPVAELPREMLESEGTMWFASSRPGELSYEDERMGGLFVHFFSEAFTCAQTDGIGVTLDAMWEYAAKRTAAYAAKFGRTQTPEKVVRELKARGPLYFSFPKERSARLRFQPDVRGVFLLFYEQSALVERIEKPADGPLEVAVYDGAVTLRRLDPVRGPEASQRFLLEAGSTVIVRPEGAEAKAHAPGFRESPIRGKGTLEGVSLTKHDETWLWLFGAGYRWMLDQKGLLGAPHAAQVVVGLIHGHLSFGLELGWGPRGRGYATWSYDEQDFETRLRAGWGWDLGGPRFDLELGSGLSLQQISYGTGGTRRPVGLLVMVGAAFRLPLPLKQPWVVLELHTSAGLRWAEGVGEQETGLYATAFPMLSVGVSVPHTR